MAESFFFNAILMIRPFGKNISDELKVYYLFPFPWICCLYLPLIKTISLCVSIQESKGIKQWTINWYTSPIMVNKIKTSFLARAFGFRHIHGHFVLNTKTFSKIQIFVSDIVHQFWFVDGQKLERETKKCFCFN